MDDLVRGDHCLVAAKGIADVQLLRGIRTTSNRFTTQFITFRANSISIT